MRSRSRASAAAAASATSAWSRARWRGPRQLYLYEGEEDVLALAVRLGLGIAFNHGFVDGNKRTGAVAMIEFLALNGYDLLMANDGTLGRWFEAVIEGRMSEPQLADAIWPFIRGVGG
jgi:death-on-curing protein